MDDNIKNSLKDCVYRNPLALTVLTNQEYIDFINNSLPFSVGIEFECYQSENYKELNIRNIPDLIDFNKSSDEFRVRIPNGIKGLICLYNITEILKTNFDINLESGIHLHIDCTDFYDLITVNQVNNNEDWILKELDKWEYKGTYNKRRFVYNSKGFWINTRSGYKTTEIRICPMSFDYHVLVEKIIHASSIINRFRKILYKSNNLIPKEIIYDEFDNSKIVNYIKSTKLNLESEINIMKNKIDDSKYEKEKFNDISRIINQRVIKLN